MQKYIFIYQDLIEKLMISGTMAECSAFKGLISYFQKG